MLTRNPTPRARPTGFTLVELLIAMVLMGIIGGAMVTLLLRQQRFYNGTNEVIQTRQQIRQAAAMLPADLRGISPRGGDIYGMTDSSIDFRAVFGSSVVCLLNARVITTVPVTLAKSSALTNWSGPPAAGDSVALFNDSSDVATNLDTWQFFEVASVASAAGTCPAASGLVQAADAAQPVYQATVALITPSNKIQIGSPVRFFRRVHYSLYRNAADNLWYLGYYSCKGAAAGGCNPIQPIGGPFQPWAAPATGTSGLQFTYYDSLGVVTANPPDVARISVVVRGQGTSLVSFSGANIGSTFRDSLRMEVYLRNRR